jgi:transcriptional regulator with XRE-family HTH domain
LLAAISDVSSVLVGKTPGQLGDWLRRELTSRGYNLLHGGQSQFAREAGIHVSIVNRVINKGQGVENDVLRRIGAALGYSFGDMLVVSGQATRDELPVRPPEELEDVPPPEEDSNPYTDPNERAIWNLDLPESLRRQIIKYLRVLIQMEAEEDEGTNASVSPIRPS